MFVIGTAGHVDHGKSLLVEALTGIDPDRLREEKARGMTIDLGFAWLALPSGRTASIVDVPGHERFIKNMLAGAGGVDLALLVVAADDGVMPQTREHLAILDLLGISHGVVALTKSDLATDDWLELLTADIDETLAGTVFSGSPVVRCSSITGAGLPELLATLDGALDRLPALRHAGRPRLPIDRVFTIGGFGTVVTGTLLDGELPVAMEIEVQPGGLRGRVRGLQSHKEAVERALPGTRTAVNVSGIEKASLRRGQVLTTSGWLRPATAVDARLRAVRASRGGSGALRHDMDVTFHTGAAEANARVRLLDCDELRPGDEAWAQIKLGEAVACVRGDHFVLRTPNDTIGGGVIVDTQPLRHRRRHAATLAALEARLSAAPEDVVLETLSRLVVVDASLLAGESGLASDVVTDALAVLSAAGEVLLLGQGAGPQYAAAARADALHRDANAALAAYHTKHNLRRGMPREELRARIAIDPRAFEALSATWDDVAFADGLGRLAAHVPRPSAEQQARIDAFLAVLRATPEAPAGAALAPDLLAYLVDTGAVVDAGGGIVFDAAAFNRMTSQVRAHIEAHGAISLAQARDTFGSSRRYAQALLEQLDRQRVTRRVGDEHVLR